MSTLYVVQAQPNPRGKDAVRPGLATNEKLNEEWVQFQAVGGDRNLTGDTVYNITFAQHCVVTGQAKVIEFTGGVLKAGHDLRLHTGRGINQLIGSVQHVYAGRDWFIWNNRCGDRVTVKYNGAVVDSAGWAPNPPEGILTRVAGTDRLEAAAGRASGF